MGANTENDGRTEVRLAFERERAEIFAQLANNILFEYDHMSDTIHFTKPIQIQKRMVRSIAECSKKQTLVPYVHPEDISIVIQHLNDELDGSIDYRCLTKEGYQWYRMELKRSITKQRNKRSCYGCLTQIHTQKQKYMEQQFMQRTDDLTRMFHLKYMQQEITKYIEQEGKHGVHALLIMDLHNFSYINENFGRMFGDTVLQQAADAIRESFPECELLGRIGSNQFMIFVKQKQPREELFLRISNIIQRLGQIYIGNHEQGVQAMFGVALYPYNGTTFLELFSHADTACYIAKTKENGNLMFYENCILHLKTGERQFYQSYEHQITGITRPNVDKEITLFALDVMKHTKEWTEGMIVLLNYLKQMLRVDYVRLYEVSNDHNQMVLTCSSGSRRQMIEKPKVIYEEMGLLSYETMFSSGFFQAGSTSHISLMPLKRSFYEMGIHSTLQCAMYNHGLFRGCLGIEDMHKERKWTEVEYSALDTMTHIFNTCLLKLRDHEQMMQNKDLDPLTQLYNYSGFRKKIASELGSSVYDRKYAIVSLNFVHFKYINDTCGYDIGDQVLYEYARELEWMDGVVFAAREMSDRFVLLVSYDRMEELKQWITEVNEDFARKQEKRLFCFRLHITAGIAELHSAKEVEQAFDRAQIARKTIQYGYKTNTCIFVDEMRTRVLKELEIIRSQEKALKDGEFQVYLQPKISLQDDQLVGAEALIRWNRTDGTMMYPDDFIPVFENNGFILKLDFFVYETVCKLLSHWMKEKKQLIPISVNVSRLHLSNHNFAKEFVDLVEMYHVPPSLLELELTESMVLDDVSHAVVTMQGLQEKGFLVSIDDFGAGYSSLNLLKDLKTDILKLDRDFFRKGDLRTQDKIIVKNIIEMAKQLDMKVLSEGVETTIQSEFLKDNQCDMAQGYLYAKPMPIEEFELFHTQYTHVN